MMLDEPVVPTIAWRDGRVRILDQTRLPETETFIDTDDWRVVADAIRRLAVRGAPAIGVAAAMGTALEARAAVDTADPVAAVRTAIAGLRGTRPTAVNLFWALDRMQRTLEQLDGASAAEVAARLEAEALAIYAEDLELSRRMGEHGAALVDDGATLLTVCNTGGLATAGIGTALAVAYAAHAQGKSIRVIAVETRPLLQGARLTAWELVRAGIPATLIVDSAAAAALRRFDIQWFLSGADRIAANGDTANKIGTYSLAVLARQHCVPFAVVAPVTTLDAACPDGDAIPIEERGRDEVARGFGRQTAPDGIEIWNPAFDVTPHRLIDAIVTDRGVHRPPFAPALAQALADTALASRP